jgi:membrane protease YdiL (CAAX protease family)
MAFLRSQDLYPAEPTRGWIPWGALAPFLALLFVIATALPGDMLISRFVNISPEGNPLDPAALLAFTLVPFGLLLLLLLAWVRYVERRPLASIGIRGEHKLREFLRGHAFGLAGLFSIVMIIWMTDGLELMAVAPAFSQPASLVPIVLLLFTFALQSSVEELLLRGWLMSVLTKNSRLILGKRIDPYCTTLIEVASAGSAVVVETSLDARAARELHTRSEPRTANRGSRRRGRSGQ